MQISKSLTSTKAINRFNRLEEEFKSIHGSRYDYTDTVYEGATKKLNVTCKLHGVFKIVIANHIRGQGCPKCGAKARAISKSKGKKYFVDKANTVHKSIYSYSNVPENVKSEDKINVVCPIHGTFTTTFNRHIDSCKGCPTCGREVADMSKRLTTEEFIQKAQSKHGDRYDYTDTVYVKQSEKVTIKCRDHGNFKQSPAMHYFQGTGCPVCSSIGAFDLSAEAYVYFIKFKEQNVYKIGITNNLKQRLYNYKGIELITKIKTTTGRQAKDIEHNILTEFSNYLYTGERFIERGFTELLIGKDIEKRVADKLKQIGNRYFKGKLL